jgi:hypothetical protein
MEIDEDLSCLDVTGALRIFLYLPVLFHKLYVNREGNNQLWKFLPFCWNIDKRGNVFHEEKC